MVGGSVNIYLAVKDVIPDHPESLYEIGYMVADRSAIFVVALIQFILSFGLMLIYFIVFGDTAAQLMANILHQENPNSTILKRWFYVLLLGVPMTFFVLKKELAELEWLSYILFGSLGTFILLMIWLLFVNDEFTDQANGLSSDVWLPNQGVSRVITAVSITLVAYGYQQNIYPIYNNLKLKSNLNYKEVNRIALLLTLSVYVSVGLLAICMFGPSISSVLLNDIGKAQLPNGKSFWESYVILSAFMVLLACHMPFIFFAGKEGILIIIDEIYRKSISNALWHKLYASG